MYVTLLLYVVCSLTKEWWIKDEMTFTGDRNESHQFQRTATTFYICEFCKCIYVDVVIVT